MTKEDARTLLRNYFKEKIEDYNELPIYDEVVTMEYSNQEISTWTFRGLLKYVYELEDKKL
jgi:hypothetical protein